MVHTHQKLDTSERRICSVMGVSRSTRHYQSAKKDSEEKLRLAMIRLTKQYGQYGYRKITQFLRIEDWMVNHKKVEHLWREEVFNYQSNIRDVGGFTTRIALSFALDITIPITSGPLILSMPSSAMLDRTRC